MEVTVGAHFGETVICKEELLKLKNIYFTY